MKAVVKRYQTIAALVVVVLLPLIVFVVSGSKRREPAMMARPVYSAIGHIQSYNDFVVGNSAGFWDS